MAQQAQIQTVFDPRTFTATHVVWCPVTRAAAIVDSVLDYEAGAAQTSTVSADAVVEIVQREGLKVWWHLETHAHADHLSAASNLKDKLGGRIGIGADIRLVQRTFKAIYNDQSMEEDGGPFDHLFVDGEAFELGELTVRVMHTPGHTPACVTYVVGDDAFVGDTLFMPDLGTARCDFPGGDAHRLFESVQSILRLPDTTRLHLCHDYAPEGRATQWQTTVAQQRTGNIHIRDGVEEAAFVALRKARDRTLGMPMLMLPSVQVNVRAGRLPPPEHNGTSYLKIPVNAF